MNFRFYIALLVLTANLIGMYVLYLRMKSRFSEKRIMGQIGKEIDRLILDLGRETDRDVAILEDRIRALQELMDKADKRILLAEREEAKRQIRPVIHNHSIPEPFEPSPPPADVPQAEPERPSEPIRIYTKPVLPAREKRPEPVIPVRERVVQMARKDISPEVIARTTGVSLGEVELILTMNNSSL